MPFALLNGHQVSSKGLTNHRYGQNCVPSVAALRQVLFLQKRRGSSAHFSRLTNRIALAFESVYMVNTSLADLKMV